MILNDALKTIVLLLRDQPWEIAIGTGTTPAWVDNLTLQNEIQREDATMESASTYLPDDTIKFSANFVLAAEQNITEVGLFCVGSRPFMLSRITFSPITIPANQSFPVTIQVPVRRP